MFDVFFEYLFFFSLKFGESVLYLKRGRERSAWERVIMKSERVCDSE